MIIELTRAIFALVLYLKSVPPAKDGRTNINALLGAEGS